MTRVSPKRAHIIYTGIVQGVGFRWAVESIARSLGLTGWVRNLPEGGVEVICEGIEEKIESFMEETKKEMKNYIRSVKISWEKPTGEFSSFIISFF